MVQLLPVCSTWKSLMTKPLGMAPLVFRVTVKKGVTLTQTAFLSKSCLCGCQRKLRLGFLLQLIMHLDADMKESQLRNGKRASVQPSSYGCTLEVAKHERIIKRESISICLRLSHRCTRRVDVCCHLPARKQSCLSKTCL